MNRYNAQTIQNLKLDIDFYDQGSEFLYREVEMQITLLEYYN
jgi:hypothetical protein